MIVVDIRGHHADRTFDERQVSFTLGDGWEFDIPVGVEKALKKFRMGEKSIVNIMSQYAFGARGSERFGIPPDTDVKYTLELKEFTKVCYAIMLCTGYAIISTTTHIILLVILSHQQ